VHFGIDRLPTETKLVQRLREGRFGLLAHPASVDGRFRHLRHLLQGLGASPAIVFGPEHGYGGEAQDMIGVEDSRDAYGTRVVSLYGKDFSALTPSASDLDGLDLVLCDLQDVGARYYTFVWTALLVLRACAARGIPLVVLDRPNPLGGVLREGAFPISERFHSFVGLEPLPVRHGFTLGEILKIRAHEEKIDPALLEVVAVDGWDREKSAYGDAALRGRWVLPSPNMPTPETALVYPGGCLLEGTNLSDGRGCTRPFEITGAPWLDGERLAKALSESGLPGFLARPMVFQPTFHKHAGLLCGGVQIHVTDTVHFRPYATYLALIAYAARAHPESFAFRTERYEFVDDIPAFDLLTGTDKARAAIAAGEAPREIADHFSQISPANAARLGGWLDVIGA
jgi:uncharacterized protein YbbC (DUF1343 family)